MARPDFRAFPPLDRGVSAVTLYALRMVIDYRFDRPSGGGRQHLRITPASLAGVQTLCRTKVEISPPPVEQTEFFDFYGTSVMDITIPAGLTQFTLTLEAAVMRQKKVVSSKEPAPDCHDLAETLGGLGNLSAASPLHFLAPSPRIPPSPAISAFAASCTSADMNCLQTMLALGEALNANLYFDASATQVDTPPDVAFAQRKGVCQDFAQIMIAGLRGRGIPAAYVAGYLRTLPPEGQPRLTGADAMHAWVRAWLGPSFGWVDYDPTNRCLVGSDHIEVGFGRDYADVAPVTGMLRLEGGQSGTHSVDIEEILPPLHPGPEKSGLSTSPQTNRRSAPSA